jgi:hypothetical protein
MAIFMKNRYFRPAILARHAATDGYCKGILQIVKGFGNRYSGRIVPRTGHPPRLVERPARWYSIF